MAPPDSGAARQSDDSARDGSPVEILAAPLSRRPWRRSGAPFVARGDPDIARELLRLTPERLCDEWPNLVINVYGSGAEQGPTQMRSTRMREFVDYIRAADDLPHPRADYLGENFGLARRLGVESLMVSYVAPFVPRLSFASRSAFWMGPTGSRSGLHADPDGVNFLCQVYGRKRFYMFAPRDECYLSPGRRFDGGARSSDIDLWDRRIDVRFPAFKQARCVIQDLDPGDILYVPRYWWHAVENLSANIAISYRVETPVSLLLNLGVLVKKGLHLVGLYRKGECTCH